MSYEWSGVFHPDPLPQAISFPDSVTNGLQISGGPARAGVANRTTAETATMTRVSVVNMFSPCRLCAFWPSVACLLAVVRRDAWPQCGAVNHSFGVSYRWCNCYSLVAGRGGT